MKISCNSTGPDNLHLCLVIQSCLTLCNLMDCSPPGTSVCGDSAGKNTGVGCHALLQGIFLTKDQTCVALCLLHWQAGSVSLVQITSKTRNRTAIWSSNPTPGHISGENDNSKRYMHPKCSWQHYLQKPRHGNGLNVHQQMNGQRWRVCKRTHTQGILFSQKKRIK